MRVACGLNLRTYLYLLSGGLEAERDTGVTLFHLTIWEVQQIAFCVEVVISGKSLG